MNVVTALELVSQAFGEVQRMNVRFRPDFDEPRFRKQRARYVDKCRKDGVDPDGQVESRDVLLGASWSKYLDYDVRKRTEEKEDMWKALIHNANGFASSQENMVSLCHLLGLFSIEGEGRELHDYVLMYHSSDRYFPLSFQEKELREYRSFEEIEYMIYWLHWDLCRHGGLGPLLAYLRKVEKALDEVTNETLMVRLRSSWSVVGKQFAIVLSNINHMYDHKKTVVNQILTISQICQVKIPSFFGLKLQRNVFNQGATNSEVETEPAQVGKKSDVQKRKTDENKTSSTKKLTVATTKQENGEKNATKKADRFVRRCWNCGEVKEKLKKCSRCKVPSYCSVECQKADFTKNHKAECRGFANSPDSHEVIRRVKDDSFFNQTQLSRDGNGFTLFDIMTIMMKYNYVPSGRNQFCLKYNEYIRDFREGHVRVLGGPFWHLLAKNPEAKDVLRKIWEFIGYVQVRRSSDSKFYTEFLPGPGSFEYIVGKDKCYITEVLHPDVQCHRLKIPFDYCDRELGRLRFFGQVIHNALHLNIPWLHTLDLSDSYYFMTVWTDICGLFCKGLQANRYIKVLNLARNGLNCSMGCTIADALPHMSALEELNLNGNNLSPLCMYRVFQSKRSNLRKLHMHSNRCGHSNLMRDPIVICMTPEQVLLKLEVLDLSNNRIGGPSCETTNYKKPDGNGKISLEPKTSKFMFDLMWSGKFRHLRELYLTDNIGIGACLKHGNLRRWLKQSPLEILDLQHCGLRPEHLQEISAGIYHGRRDSRLRHLNLSENDFNNIRDPLGHLSTQSIMFLCHGRSLETLLLRETRFGREVVERICKFAHSPYFRDAQHGFGVKYEFKPRQLLIDVSDSVESVHRKCETVRIPSSSCTILT